MKRSNCLLVSASLGLLYLGYLITYLAETASTTTDTYEQIGVGIVVMLVIPHLVLLSLAIIFNWIGYAGNFRWAAITCGVLYSVSAFTFIAWSFFEIPSIVLSFVGASSVSKLMKSDLSRAPRCVNCGERRSQYEPLNKYGFCESCRDELRSEVKERLDQLNHAVSLCDSDALDLSDTNKYLTLISDLEKSRKKFPFFKSSLEPQYSALCKNKQKLDPSFSPPAEFPYKCKSLEGPSSNPKSKATKPLDWKFVVLMCSFVCVSILGVYSYSSMAGLEEELSQVQKSLDSAQLDISARDAKIAELQSYIDKNKTDTPSSGTIRLKNGHYTSGVDFTPGTYDVEAVKGVGNVSSSNMFGGGINAIMGKKSDDVSGISQQKYQNISLPEETVLSISDVEVRLTKVD